MADVVADAPSGVASGAPGARRGRDRAPVDAPAEPEQRGGPLIEVAVEPVESGDDRSS